MRKQKIPITKSKKGMAFEAVHSILWMIYYAMMLLVVITLIYFLLGIDINIREAETDMIAYNLMYSSASFTYRNDDLQRTYPNYVNIDRFNNDTLNGFLADQNHIAAKVTLVNLNDSTTKSIYLNKLWFDRWYPLAATGVPGPGGATLTEKAMPVIITDSKMQRREPGMLLIDAVVPNS